MASEPNSSETARSLAVISSRAASQEILSKAALDGPFGATRRSGYSTRSGEYTRSRYFATLAHKKPRVTGWAGSPWIFTARSSSTVIRTPQASGQSCGQAAWTTFLTMTDYKGESAVGRRLSCSNVAPDALVRGGSDGPGRTGQGGRGRRPYTRCCDAL